MKAPYGHVSYQTQTQTIQNTELRIVTRCTRNTNSQHLHEETNILPIKHLDYMSTQSIIFVQTCLHKSTQSIIRHKTNMPALQHLHVAITQTTNLGQHIHATLTPRHPSRNGGPTSPLACTVELGARSAVKKIAQRSLKSRRVDNNNNSMTQYNQKNWKACSKYSELLQITYIYYSHP